MASELTGSRVKAPEIRRGDTVLILTGKDAGKRGVVSRVLRNAQGTERRRTGWRPTSIRPVSVVVEGLNIAKRHTKPRPRMNQADRVPTVQQGGIIDIPQPIAIGNVMIICQSCDQPTRIGHLRLDNGNRVRVCTRPGCGKQLEVKP